MQRVGTIDVLPRNAHDMKGWKEHESREKQEEIDIRGRGEEERRGENV